MPAALSILGDVDMREEVEETEEYIQASEIGNNDDEPGTQRERAAAYP